jgi:chitinase
MLLREKLSLFSFLLLLIISTSTQAQDLPDKLLVGYWHNWVSTPNSLRIADVPEGYDVINVSFAIPTVQLGSEMTFVPENSLYTTNQAFISEVESLQQNGKKVLISIGGANAGIHIDDTTKVANFVTSMRNIIDTFGFDGIDIDLEGSSLILSAGDTDFRSPTSPLIVYFTQAILELATYYDENFIITSAPETAYVQGGYGAYSSIWGAYLPLIHALRDNLTYIHVQHYNSGTMYGRDGGIYTSGTADFHVAMSEALLAGFAVDANGSNIFFEPLEENQVLFGIPASPLAAGSGYTDPAIVREAVRCLVTGEGYGGEYQMANPEGYPGFRGLMTWSINWDVANNLEFVESYRGFLDSLNTTSDVDLRELTLNQPTNLIPISNYPNPFNGITRFTFELKNRGNVEASIYNINGRIVDEIVLGSMPAGNRSFTWKANNLPSGNYFIKIRENSVVLGQKKITLLN